MFAPFERWNTLYDRWKAKDAGLETELFDQLAAFPSKDHSGLEEKLEYIKEHIDAERVPPPSSSRLSQQRCTPHPKPYTLNPEPNPLNPEP